MRGNLDFDLWPNESPAMVETRDEPQPDLIQDRVISEFTKLKRRIDMARYSYMLGISSVAETRDVIKKIKLDTEALKENVPPSSGLLTTALEDIGILQEDVRNHLHDPVRKLLFVLKRGIQQCEKDELLQDVRELFNRAKAQFLRIKSSLSAEQCEKIIKTMYALSASLHQANRRKVSISTLFYNLPNLSNLPKPVFPSVVSAVVPLAASSPIRSSQENSPSQGEESGDSTPVTLRSNVNPPELLRSKRRRSDISDLEENEPELYSRNSARRLSFTP